MVEANSRVFIPESFIDPCWLIPREMKTTGVPWKTEHHARLKKFQDENKNKSVEAEDWMAQRLVVTRMNWQRQYIFGFRLYDFFCQQKGVAIEVDGASHNDPKQRAWDYIRDEYNFRRSAVLVLRVKNFDEDSAAIAVERAKAALFWKQRRIAIGMVGHNRTRLLLGAFNRREEKRIARQKSNQTPTSAWL